MKTKHALAICIVLSVVFLTVVITRHALDKPLAESVEALPESVDVALTNLHYSHNENGVRQWVLDADDAAYQRQAGLAQLTNITLKFFRAGSYSEIVLTAGHGTFDQNSNMIEVWDHVLITTDQHDQLTLEHLFYDQALRQLSSDGPVTYDSSQMTLSGRGLLLNINDGSLLIKNQVRALLRSQADR